MTIEQKKKLHRVLLFFVLAFLLGIGTLSLVANRTASKKTPDNRSTQIDMARSASHMQQNPKMLQDAFLNDIRDGVNDQFTKSSAYFITHRYFDNNGNIYEIYDYIHAHPELSFLNEAENIYPKYFKLIQDRTLSKIHSDRGTYAYLAYLETLDKYGYADVATYATLANQYAKIVFLRKYIEEKTRGTEAYLGYSQSDWRRDAEKARLYANKARPVIENILNKKTDSGDIPAQDILVGLNQYGSAMRYAEALGSDISSEPKSSREIFTFSMDYASRNVPELYLFTSFLNASTLNIIWAKNAEIETALYPILDFDTAHNPPQNAASIIAKIISLRYEKTTNLGEMSLDLYGKPNVVALSKRVPMFKKWLMSNGWTEADFIYTAGPYGPQYNNTVAPIK